MRSEQQMLELILSTAQADERIRAVILNGSRVNPNAPRDCLQDYDIVYLVTELGSFLDDPTWIDRFGERLILQLPDTMTDPPPEHYESFAYLMQFADGNRIDLGLYPLDRLDARLADSLTRVLLDKDGRLPALPPPSDSSYLPRPPSAKAFADCCNEFWWVCPYVAKGLWRDELPYAKTMLDQALRDELLKMLTWYVGVRTEFTRGPGKFGKYLRRELAPELWALLERTYADADAGHTWDALLVMGDLFRRTARAVAAHCGYAYPHEDDRRVSAHLRHVRGLPKDAAEIY